MRKIFSGLLTLFLSSFSLAGVIKKDVLRIEFSDENGSETFDLSREYFDGAERLFVHVKPSKVDENDKDENIPSVIWKIDVQAGTVSVISNFSQIPNDVGTQFNLDGKTIANYKIYLSTLINNKHEIRLLYAPLKYNVEFVPEQDIQFGDSLFLMGANTEALYKFNSYRLSYIYHFDQLGIVQFRLGFSAKIRDAETALAQGNNTESFTDIGFVPLFLLGTKINLSENLFLDAEIEGSWAPQGYAVDTRLFLSHQLTNHISIGAGAGYLDGGANVASVNTFARLFYGFGKVIVTIPQTKMKKKRNKKENF